MVIFDTLSYLFAGGDENAASDAVLVLQRIGRIQDETGAHVMLLHHPGKDKTKGARGSSALKGAVDTEITLSGGKDAQGEIRTLKVTKQKDMEPISDMCFRLQNVDCMPDTDLDPVRSCALEWLPRSRVEKVETVLNHNQQAALDTLLEIDQGDAGGVKLAAWYEAHETDLAYETFRSQVRGLKTAGFVETVKRGYYQPSEKTAKNRD
jgi:hypothetical protein